MQLFFKAAIVGFLTLVILIPLAMIGDIVRDRQAYRAQAIADIAANVGTAQTVSGPALVVPIVENRTVLDANGKVSGVEREEKNLIYFPSKLDIAGKLPTSIKSRGMHEVRVYEWKGAAKGSFLVTLPSSSASVTREIGKPYLVYEFSDPRGLQGSPVIKVNGVALKVEPGAGFREGNGVHVRLDAPAPGSTLTLDTLLDIQLRGTQSFSVLPLGDDNRIDLASDWSAPKFVGASPEQDRVAKGFSAHWRVTSLSANAQGDYVNGKAISQLPGVDEHGTIERAVPGRITVGLVDPVSVYASTGRAIKYGILFVAVTFAGFFLFEFLKHAPIHPIQYLLVGLAIAIFFLLLLSMSEHMAFGWAYLLAAVACIGLITYYLAAVLRGWVPALGFAGLLSALYGVLYGVLVSEDASLVMGSALLFVLLAGIIVLTRKVDWYAVSSGRSRGGLRQFFMGSAASADSPAGAASPS